MIHPVLAGEGRRLLINTNFADQFNLKLVEWKHLPSGCMALQYSKL
ncbi:hypothetical protein ACFQZS_06115 [Mucilaginibacter calamicampi]|uniref:Uncharacterized protein n=1 Tax=Mucilaginibacter calamicampi TaxID=1302352 RepID=A0ABW2YTE4_9SPHI